MATLEEIINFYSRVPLFRSLNKRQLEVLAKRTVERDYTAGTAIITQGKGGEGFFVVYKGKVEIQRMRSDGTTAVVNTLLPGDFFGEMALLDDGPRTATAVAIEPTVCLVLPRWDFLAILRDDPEMAIVILEEMAKRFRIALESL